MMGTVTLLSAAPLMDHIFGGQTGSVSCPPAPPHTPHRGHGRKARGKLQGDPKSFGGEEKDGGGESSPQEQGGTYRALVFKGQ